MCEMSNEANMTMPVVFISHGSPMLPFEDIPARKFMLGLGAKLPRPTAILCISAHWESAVVGATGAAMPKRAMYKARPRPNARPMPTRVSVR